MLYRTIYLDLGVHRKRQPWPSPLPPPITMHPLGRVTDRKNVWVSARVLAQKKLVGVGSESSSAYHQHNQLATPHAEIGEEIIQMSRFSFPVDLVSLLRTTRILDTGPHDSDSCASNANITVPLSQLQIWRFRSGQDRNEMSPRQPGERSWGGCGTGHTYTVKGCSGPTECSLARHLNPTHMVVLLSKHWTICPINDPLTFLTLPALARMSTAVRKHTLTLPANEVLPDRDYGHPWPARSYVTIIPSTIRLTHFELILLPDRSGHFDFKGFHKTVLPDESAPSHLAKYLLRTSRYHCQTACRYRMPYPPYRLRIYRAVLARHRGYSGSGPELVFRGRD